MTLIFLFAVYVVGAITVALQEWGKGWQSESIFMALGWPLVMLFGAIQWGLVLLELFRQWRK